MKITKINPLENFQLYGITLDVYVRKAKSDYEEHGSVVRATL